MRMKINTTLYDKLGNIEEVVEEKLKKDLKSKAAFIAERSPSDTGAYVTSWYIKDSYSSGRGKSSKGKPRGVDKRPEGYQNLVSDINALDLEKGLVVIGNGAPHAKYVKDTPQLFASIKNLYTGRKGI